MFDAFKKWSLSGHTFTFVKLAPAEVESLGAATRQFLEKEGAGDREVMVRGSEVVLSPNVGLATLDRLLSDPYSYAGAYKLAAFPGK